MTKAVASLSNLLSRALYALYTLLLFTKSDIKTILLPVTGFALAATLHLSLSHIPHVVGWVWLHLLQCDLSNQIIDPDEDAINKPDRPIPSGRITLPNAFLLRWMLVPVCWALSLAYGTNVVRASVVLSALALLYNEHGASGHGVLRNVVNAAAYACFEAGATLIAGTDRSQLDVVSVWAICVSTLAILTTIYAQDFRDLDGDKAIGRKTIPVVYPRIARWSMLVLLPAWSLALASVWRLDIMSSIALVLLAALIGARFVVYSTVRADQVSYHWYNAWITVVHALPAYYRHYSSVN